MKIGILTFHCVNNYGAVLQAYGLQEALRLMGHDAYIMDYRPASLTGEYKVFNFTWRNELPLRANLYLLAWHLLVIPIRLIRSLRFRRFAGKYLRIYPFNPDSSASDFDAYICGSDQIWNPSILGGFDGIYFCRFPACKGKRAVAYAASAGSVKNLPGNDWQERLSPFSAVSVREKSLADFLRSKTGRATEQVLDPVLLCGRSVYEALATPVKGGRRYVLVFMLGFEDAIDPRIDDIAHKVAQERGLEVRYLLPMSNSLKNTGWMKTEGPGRFVSLVRGAEYIVTTSFHGTAFSILFEKDFTTVLFNASSSERMLDLLGGLGLAGRLARDSESMDISPINYAPVSIKLDELRKTSLSFLQSALE